MVDTNRLLGGRTPLDTSGPFRFDRQPGNSFLGLLEGALTGVETAAKLEGISRLRADKAQQKLQTRSLEMELEKDQQALEVVRNAWEIDPQTGRGSFNREKIVNGLMGVDPQRAIQAQQAFDKIVRDEHVAEQQRLKADREALKDPLERRKLEAEIGATKALESQRRGQATREARVAPLEEQQQRADLEATRALTRQRRAATDKAIRDAAPSSEKPLTAQQQISAEGTLRNQFLQSNREFRLVSEAFGRVKAASTQPSRGPGGESRQGTAAGDIALLFAFMKIVDPGSTVREGEQALAANAAGVPERIRTLYNRVLSGEVLGENQRKDFKLEATNLFRSAERDFAKRETTFRGIAKRSGLDPDNIIVDLRSADAISMAELQQAAQLSGRPVQQIIEDAKRRGMIILDEPQPGGAAPAAAPAAPTPPAVPAPSTAPPPPQLDPELEALLRQKGLLPGS